MKSLVLTAVLLLAGVAGASAAQEKLPAFNLKQTCEATVSGTLPGNTTDGCVKDEQAARSSISKEWSSFNPADRQTCRRTAGSPDAPNSYVEMLVCLTMARDARKVSP